MYWQNYNLEHDPFDVEQGTAVCYLSPQWKQLIDLLLHLSQTSQSLLLVTGLSGMGKTTLLRQFVQQVGDSAGVCKIQGDDSIGPDVLRYLLAKHLDLALLDNQKETFQRQMFTKLATMQESGQHYLLVIDDAHLLPERTLTAILMIATQQPESTWPLHVILLGGPQLEATISDITAQHFEEGVTHTSRIKPLTREATEQYIYHRLNAAGSFADFPFSREDMDEIYQNSGGIPGKINLFARQMLEDKIPEGRTMNYPGFSLKKWGVLGAVLSGMALLGMIFLFFPAANDKNDNNEAQSPAAMEQAAAEPAPQFQDDVPPGDTTVEDEQDKAGDGERFEAGGLSISAAPVADDGSLAQGAAIESENGAISETLSTPPLAQDAPTSALSPVQSSVESGNHSLELTTPAPVAADAAAPIADKAAVVTTPTPPMPVSPPIALESKSVTPPPAPAVKPKTAKSASVVAKKNLTPKKSLAASKSSAASKPQKMTPPPSVAATAKSPVKMAYSANEKQLLAAKGDNYTLQVMGSYNEAQLRNFVKQAQLQGKIRYFRTYLQGKPWYVVVVGEYTDLTKAQNAIEKLPAKVQAVKPWPRRLSSIQEVIKDRNA